MLSCSTTVRYKGWFIHDAIFTLGSYTEVVISVQSPKTYKIHRCITRRGAKSFITRQINREKAMAQEVPQ